MKKKTLLTAIATLTIGSVSAMGLMLTGCGHTHKYSTDWKSDESGHWHYATCDDLKEGDADYKSDFAAHTYGDDDECDVCGYKKVTPPEDGDDDDDDDDKEVTISLDAENITLSLSKLEQKINATVSNGGTVTWESDNESVAPVGEDGTVYAMKPGTATITATVSGTEISATCEVNVENAYYLIGGEDSSWNKVGTFDQSGAIFFMPTETAGIYKTASIELSALSNFQIAPVGDTSDDWWKQAFNGDYIKDGDEVLSKNDGGNIAVQNHGKYTITLDLTGEQAVVSGVCDEEIEDGDVEYVYYLIGGMNNWTTADTVEDAGDYAFTANEDGTYTLTADLTKGWEFKVVIVGMQYKVEYGESAIPRNLIGDNGSATIETAYKLTWTTSANIGVGLSGTYTFTFNPEGGTNNILSYTFAQNDSTETEIPEAPEIVALHYYIKGDKVTDNWQNDITARCEFTETEEGSGIYTLTIELEAGDSFMFYSFAEYEDGIEQKQVDYFNGGNSTLTAVGECVTVSGSNFLSGEAGTYTITLDPEEKTVNITYTAADAQE